jgi:hypothetical protein
MALKGSRDNPTADELRVMALKGSRDNPTGDELRVMASVVREFERRMLYFLLAQLQLK